jgi:teichuronic acid biosynthesis glycosyltransferase TuaH
MSSYSFLFLVANTPWVYALAEALGTNYHTYATRFYDWRTSYLLRPTWEKPASLYLLRTLKVFPPGYVGRLESLFRPYMQWQVQQWHRSLYAIAGTRPWIIVPYPFSVSWVRHLPSDRLIYYNLDDYVHYQPSRKAQILAQEAELLERAALTLCLSQFQVEALQKRYPHKADKIHHFPLGVADNFINPEIGQSPEPNTVGYIGNLTDRIDWQLVYQIANACQDLTFVFVGGLNDVPADTQPNLWKTLRAKTLALPNVRHIDKVPQSEVIRYYWSFAVNWIPYDIQHTFNQASCPTKVMDGIASGRPVISTDIPECRLYHEWITISHSVDDAVSLLRQKLHEAVTAAGQQIQINQYQFALHQTWEYRAETLVSLLDKSSKAF